MDQVVESMAKVLLLTVGMGHELDHRLSLDVPIQKSMRKEKWTKIVLLPSAKSLEHAERLKRDCPDLPIHVEAPLADGVEEDPNACFAVYDGLIERLKGSGFPASTITADYTRGTKTMSSALMLAAASRGVGVLRYVSGQRGQGNTVIPGTERVIDFPSAYVTARRRLDDGRQLMLALQFAAVPTVVRAPECPQELRPEALALCWSAEFWGAWDHLDYTSAEAVLRFRPSHWPARVAGFRPNDSNSRFLYELASGAGLSSDERARHAWALAGDLLENARRRVQQMALEDAFLRCYRVIELIGQARLFELGLDSEKINPEDEQVFAWVEYQRKKKGEPLLPNRRGVLTLAREKVASLLKFKKDPLGRKLLDLADAGALPVKDRNLSILIHGFAAKATTDRREAVETMIEQIKSIYQECAPPDLRGMAAAASFSFEMD